MKTILTNTHANPTNAASTKADNGRSDLASKMVRFLLHFLEMQLAMGLGMIPWHWLVGELRASPLYAEAFQRGSALSTIGHGLFMTIPMVGWMIIRQHGWRHSLEMGAAMFAPGVAILVLCWLGADTYWPWLTLLSVFHLCVIRRPCLRVFAIGDDTGLRNGILAHGVCLQGGGTVRRKLIDPWGKFMPAI